MKNTMFITSLFIILFAASCGGGGGQSTSSAESVEIENAADFNGKYAYRSDNCTTNVIMAFNIIQNDASSVSIFITDAGQSGYQDGDNFDGSITNSDGEYYVGISNTFLLCAATFILDESTAQAVSENMAIQAHSGDLLASCRDDGSFDESCNITYVHTL